MATTQPSSIDLALDRTQLALERTLMAWVRTAVSMISFGFSIYKFFAAQPAFRAGRQETTPRDLALALIALGTLGLSLALVQHAAARRHFPSQGRIRPVASVVAALLIVVGVGSFVAVLRNL